MSGVFYKHKREEVKEEKKTPNFNKLAIWNLNQKYILKKVVQFSISTNKIITWGVREGIV